MQQQEDETKLPNSNSNSSCNEIPFLSILRVEPFQPSLAWLPQIDNHQLVSGETHHHPHFQQCVIVTISINIWVKSNHHHIPRPPQNPPHPPHPGASQPDHSDHLDAGQVRAARGSRPRLWPALLISSPRSNGGCIHWDKRGEERIKKVLLGSSFPILFPPVSGSNYDGFQ